MSFIPALPSGGYIGWMALKRTAPVQKAVFEQQASISRDETYFRERIGTIDTADALLKDRRLLSVALGAFGLGDDINNRHFLLRVMEDGTIDSKALSMRLADTRYREFSAAFGFGDFATPNTTLSDFADRILSRWKERSFESAVGQVDDTLRLALNAQRELSAVAKQNGSDDVQWFTLMGQRPLRQVLEVAFGLPTAFGTLDIDRQKSALQAKAQTIFGDSSVAQFAEPERMEALLRRFLLQSQIAQNTSPSPGSTALTLLQQMTGRAR